MKGWPWNIPERVIVVGSELVMVSDAIFEGIEGDKGFGFWDLVVFNLLLGRELGVAFT
jgi:hypothetical protein